MAADRTGTTLEKHDDVYSSDFSPEHGCNIPKRHARVTVKYNRKELQRRLDVEKWIEDRLDRLYSGQVRACVRQPRSYCRGCSAYVNVYDNEIISKTYCSLSLLEVTG